ncbi:MAG: hypothetical protein AB7V42_15260 [Thermoleophilia bacterium]
MGTIHSTETARIEALLDRLDPECGRVCQVEGCVHEHVHAGEGVPLAA